MDDDLMDEAAKRLFPELHERNRRAAARIVPGTTRPQSPTRSTTSGDVPGRTRPERLRQPAREVHSPIWARHPKFFPGHTEPFFTIGALAEAFGRSPNTLRAWITNGWLPNTKYRSRTRDPRGSRRMYTRTQIEGLVQIAEEERLLGTKRRNPASTHFPQRAKELFAQLAAEERRTA